MSYCHSFTIYSNLLNWNTVIVIRHITNNFFHWNENLVQKRLKSDTFFDKGCIRRVHQLQRQSIKTVRLVSYINRKKLERMQCIELETHCQTINQWLIKKKFWHKNWIGQESFTTLTQLCFVPKNLCRLPSLIEENINNMKWPPGIRMCSSVKFGLWLYIKMGSCMDRSTLCWMI